MMEDDSPSWVVSVPLSFLLLCGAAAVFLLGYLPEEKKTRECEALVREANQRISELVKQEEVARRRISELRGGYTEAVEEAAREVLRLGADSDFLPRN